MSVNSEVQPSLDSQTLLQPGVISQRQNWLCRHFFKTFAGRLILGSLVLETPDGERIQHAALKPGPQGVLCLHNWRALSRLFFEGDLGFAEAYIDGDWSSPNLAGLIELAAQNEKNMGGMQGSLLFRLTRRLRHLARPNTRRGSQRNIIQHYDLGNAFYSRWLDKSMSYSSALFSTPTQSLEDAQTAKLDRILSMLQLKGGERILEIGCGWGGLAEHLIRKHDCHVTGLTLSPSQLSYAQNRMTENGMAASADLRLQDYRDVDGVFDRIVSIEMLEAVGEAYWPVYFQTLRRRLAPAGTAVLQVITINPERFVTYRREVDFIQRYIFPGGMLPSPQVLEEQIVGAGLKLTQNFTFGESYARTLAEWQRRFQDAWPTIQPLGFGIPFKRMWEYYLAYCEAGFRAEAINVGLYRIKKTQA